jgi:hypothetical protein
MHVYMYSNRLIDNIFCLLLLPVVRSQDLDAVENAVRCSKLVHPVLSSRFSVYVPSVQRVVPEIYLSAQAFMSIMMHRLMSIMRPFWQ